MALRLLTAILNSSLKNMIYSRSKGQIKRGSSFFRITPFQFALQKIFLDYFLAFTWHVVHPVGPVGLLAFLASSWHPLQSL